MRLIRPYAGRACFKISIAFAMLGKRLAGIWLPQKVRRRDQNTVPGGASS
jgi:hypothetical protein